MTDLLAAVRPLVACDRVTAIVDGDVRRITGELRVHGDGPYLPDHFPGLTIFPGVFVLEAVVQAAAAAFGEPDGGRLRLTAVRSLRFLVPLRPGDLLRVLAEATEVSPPHPVRLRADCRRGDGVRVATVTVECGWSG
ncbi:hypothetical protein ACGFJ5_22090 [Micromonospora echinaurantiaca]|uniref:hypothetical protein n=1 Tax=Micromonospora echinaurantiaca TaxID=47857 RepID=UPI0037193045